MKLKILAIFRRIIKDILFIRVCLFIFGVPFAALGVFGAFEIEIIDKYDWGLLGLLISITIFGLFLLYAAILGKEKLLESASNGVSDGGELIGIFILLFVFFIGAPNYIYYS